MILIRSATPADAAKISELAERTFRDTFAAHNTPENLEAFLRSHYTPELQARELGDPNRTYWLAEAEGTFAGFALMNAGSRDPHVVAERPTQLERLYVDRPFLGAGVGRSLMAHCLDDARANGHDVLWLGVWEHNTKAIGFYERHGFERVGEMAFSLGTDRQRDWVLARDLR